jgi:endonuclease-3 related protein
MHKTTPSRQIGAIYTTLADAWGPQHWWPARTPFEVIVGAYLTQNTNWTNVERALEQLRSAHVLSVNAIRRIPVSEAGKTDSLIRILPSKSPPTQTFCGIP